MRILHLIHRSWPYHGGAERYVWEHAAAASRHGHTSTIATTDAWDMSWMVSRKGRHLPAGKYQRDGVEIIRFPIVHPLCQNLMRGFLRRAVSGGRDRFYYPNPFVPGLDRWLGKISGFEMVHANAMPFLLHGGYRLALRTGIPLVTAPHANIGSRHSRIEPLKYFDGDQPEILRQSSMVVAQNQFEASVYLEECDVRSEKLFIHGSGIDPDEWLHSSGNYARAELGIANSIKLVLSMTAHCRDKGSMTLLNSSIDLWQRGYDFALVLAGPVMHDFQQHLDSCAEKNLIPQDKLIVTGYVSESLRRHLFTAADIVAAPSRLDAFGIVLLDGWMGNAAVIGCNAGGMPDIISHGEDGFLIDFDDEGNLAQRIAELLDNSELRKAMAEKGRRKTLENYTWGQVTDRFYRELEKRRLV